MKTPYWSVINTNTGEEIIRVKAEKDIETVHIMVSQWFEEEWEDCGDQVRITKMRP